MPSSADPELAAALTAVADKILRQIAGTSAPVVLIDGRSGSGKSTLAAVVARRADAQLLALDDVYPGWDGLDAGTEHVRTGVLEPRAAGQPGSWRRWDWAENRAAEEHSVDAHLPLVVEGSGILTPRTAPLATLTVWLDAPETSRRERAMARDGETYRPHWERWAAQESTHVTRDDPAGLADLAVVLP